MVQRSSTVDALRQLVTEQVLAAHQPSQITTLLGNAVSPIASIGSSTYFKIKTTRSALVNKSPLHDVNSFSLADVISPGTQRLVSPDPPTYDIRVLQSVPSGTDGLRVERGSAGMNRSSLIIAGAIAAVVLTGV